MRAPISLAISVVSIAGSMRRWMAKIHCSWRRSASTADCMSGYCSLQASALAVDARAHDAPGRARPRPPGGARSSANFFCQSGPSSAAMRRLTKAQPIGGAWLCSLVSSAAYSGGSASGMVAISCATFMIGPLRPPSAAASSIAFLPRSSVEPEKARAGDARRDAAHIGADARIARGAGGEAVLFAVGHLAQTGRARALRPIVEIQRSYISPLLTALSRERNDHCSGVGKV